MTDIYGDEPVEKPAETVTALRCSFCRKLLAERVTAPYRLVCGRCQTANETNT